MTKSARPAFKTLLDCAHSLADLSGAAILPHFRKVRPVTNKSSAGFDPVTAADRAAEGAIARALARHWPEHGLIGEELGSTRKDARLRWIVDPIDGTRSFIMGSPLWGTLIGLMDDKDVVLGLMDQPFTGERFWSGPSSAHARAAGSKTRRIRTRECRQLTDATMSTTHPDLFARGDESEAFARLKGKARMTRFGGDCYAYCLLASGLIDLIVEAGLQPYDVVALIPIIERAGGRITTWDGAPATGGGRIVAAGDARLHEQAMRVLAG